MKRRRPTTTENPQSDKPYEATTEVQSPEVLPIKADDQLEHTTALLSPSATPQQRLTLNTSKRVSSDERLEPDTDDYTDNEEPLLPIAYSRPGITDSKARDLFTRYGLIYQAQEHITEREPPRKIRRVEKPLRIRVHWTCHACKTQFGLEKACAECGHQKCPECPREPPKRVQDVMQNGRHMMEQSKLSQQALLSSDGGSRGPAIDSSPCSTPGHSPLPSPSLEPEPSIEVDDDQVGHPSFDFSIYARPTAGIHLFGSGRNDDRFEEFMSLTNKGQCSYGSGRLRMISSGEIPMMKAVPRVYRKPRQRVRYTCEHCSTLLVEGDRCRECDHNRFARNP